MSEINSNRLGIKRDIGMKWNSTQRAIVVE